MTYSVRTRGTVPFATLSLMLLLGACERQTAAVPTAPATDVQVVQQLVSSSSATCGDCLFGPVTISRPAALQDFTSTMLIPAVPGTGYELELRGAAGPKGAVMLNGAVILSDDPRKQVTLPVTLTSDNILVIRLAGKRALDVTVTIRARPVVTLDVVRFASPPSLEIGGTAVSYDAVIANRALTTRHSFEVQGWIVQGPARRAAGGQTISCGLAPGVLPSGRCVRTANGLLASNTGAGVGTLVAGSATALIELRRHTPDGTRVVESESFPVTLTAGGASVVRVDVTPSDVSIPASVGATQQLIANVQVTGSAPPTVAWSSSNTAVAVVDAQGLVTVVSRGATLVTARSTFDPSKEGTSLVSVGTSASSGNGVNVSPGYSMMGAGANVQLAAQLTAGTGTITWTSSNPAVAVVDVLGRVTTAGAGTATIVATSQSDPSRSASATIEAYDFHILSPASPTNVSSGTTLPAANPLNVPIVAEVCGASGVFFPGIVRVDYFTAGGTQLLGSQSSSSMTDNGVRRCFKWTFSWTPGAGYGLGPQAVMARAYDTWQLIAGSPVNSNITITNP